MAKKSILYIITKSVWGGAGKYVYDLSVSMSGDFDVAVAAGGQNVLARRIIKAGLPYFEIKHFQRNINPFKELLAGWEILRLLAKLKPDIVHVNSSKAGGIAGLAVKIYGIGRRRPKTIFTVHGWAFGEDRPKAELILIRLFSKITALFYDRIICVSEYDRQQAVKNNIAPDRKLTTIHNGIKTPGFLPAEEARKKLSDRTSQTVIGTVAEWTKNKGIIYLLEAVRIVRNKGYDPDVVLIGGGENPDKEKLYQYIRNNNLDNIYLHEWLPDAASCLKAFDIFVLPSIKEGLPYTILEAAAAGIPVIATNVGGIPEVLPEQCLVQPKNSRQLAERIISFLNNPEAVKESARAIQQNKEFRLETMIEKTKKLY